MADEIRTPAAERPAGDAPREGQRSGGDGPRGDRSGGDRPRFGGRSGPGGPPREGGRKFFRRKKVCKFCVEKIENINYKDYRLLGQFVAESGKIVPRRLTGGVLAAPASSLGGDQAGAQHRAAAICRARIVRNQLSALSLFPVRVWNLLIAES